MRLALALALVAGGCTCGGPTPPRLVGKVLDEAGAPLAHVPVSLEHSTDVECATVHDARQATTDDAGTYQFELSDDERGWLAARFGPDTHCLALRLDRDAGVSVWSALFSSDAGTQSLTGPTLQEWGGAPAVVSTAPVLGVNYDDSSLPQATSEGVPVGFGDASGAWVWLETGEGEPIWQPGAHPTPSLTVAAQVVEDFASPRVRALAWRTGSSGPLAWYTAYDGRPLAVSSGVAAPSRGIACDYVDAGPGPCALTDGSLAEVLLLESPEVRFFWPAPVTVSKVALRGLSFVPVALFAGDRVVVEAPSDAGTADGGWSPIGSASASVEYVWVTLAPVTTQALRVRVVGSDGSAEPLLGMSEASFW